jgi:hypothetical protein
MSDKADLTVATAGGPIEVRTEMDSAYPGVSISIAGQPVALVEWQEFQQRFAAHVWQSAEVEAPNTTYVTTGEEQGEQHEG